MSVLNLTMSTFKSFLVDNIYSWINQSNEGTFCHLKTTVVKNKIIWREWRDGVEKSCVYVTFMEYITVNNYPFSMPCWFPGVLDFPAVHVIEQLDDNVLLSFEHPGLLYPLRSADLSTRSRKKKSNDAHTRLPNFTYEVIINKVRPQFHIYTL